VGVEGRDVREYVALASVEKKNTYPREESQRGPAAVL